VPLPWFTFFASSAKTVPVILGPDRGIFRWTAALYACIALTLAILFGMAIWGIWHDLDQVQATFINSEMQRLRSHADRTVLRIVEDFRKNKGSLNDDFREAGFLRKHWEVSVKRDRSRLYSAIVLPNGEVYMHTDPALEGERLEATWYQNIVREAGQDVVDTNSPALTGGGRALDVRLPIILDDHLLGTYHSGLNYAWLESEIQLKQAPTKQVWSWLLVCIFAVVMLAGVSLFQISRKMAVLHEGMKVARIRRFAELGQLMAGIVHEIRNPLNAVRLSLHVLSRQLNRSSNALPPIPVEDPSLINLAQIILETNQEIERVEGLMRILLGYARPDHPHPENLDVCRELEATLNFLKPVLERAEVAVHAHFTESPVFINMDRDRLRQVMLNLVNNAKEATGPDGQIRVEVDASREHIEIVVSDNGPGVPLVDRERIFEPFYSTKENGTGLGLALVRRYVEEVGGTVVCERNQPCGARFRCCFLRVAEPSPLKESVVPSRY